MPSRRGVKTAATADVPTPKPEGAPPTPTQPPVIQRSLTVPAGDSSSRASVTSDEDRSDIGSESYDSDATYDRFAFLLDPTPTSEQLNSMGLRLGSNTIQFDVYSGSGRSQKRSTVTSKIFVWTPRSRVVISDIDGTITKSDILGHIYYYIGRDWTHNGVAKLFTMIKVGVLAFVDGVFAGVLSLPTPPATWVRNHVPHVPCDWTVGLHTTVFAERETGGRRQFASRASHHVTRSPHRRVHPRSHPSQAP